MTPVSPQHSTKQHDSLMIELPEGESPLALIADRQQGFGLEAIQRGLAVVQGKQPHDVVGADAVLQQIAAPGKALLQGLEFELGGILRRLPQPVREP